jgi:hypothetical protein
MCSLRLNLVFVTLLVTTVFGGCRSRTNSFPSYPVNARDPSHVELSFENILFNTQADIRLHGWFIPHQEARATLVWFHGSAGNISDRLLNIKQLHDWIKINIFIFDYHGYGQRRDRF